MIGNLDISYDPLESKVRVYARMMASEGVRIIGVYTDVYCHNRVLYGSPCSKTTIRLVCSYKNEEIANKMMQYNNKILDSPLWKVLNNHEVPNESI